MLRPPQNSTRGCPRHAQRYPRGVFTTCSCVLFTGVIAQVTAQERVDRLTKWDNAPAARECHPPSAAEHLLPLLVVAGAAGDDAGTQTFKQSDFFDRFTISNYCFGKP
eukprot:m.54990 g.54990  ORF g.54990 m.54990 type:complete len:108 (+) comp9230_c0_seq2:766-1089(+)